MITNFLSDNKNILSDSILFKKNNKTEEYIKQQNNIINKFTNNLIEDIYKNIFILKNKKQFQIKNILKKNIWKLWNNSYNLGIVHAENELNSNFNNNINLVEFEENEDKKVNKTIKDKLDRTRVVKRVRREESITKNTGITELEKTEFGRIYLEKRIDKLGDNLKDSYKEELLKEDGIIDRFFKRKGTARVEKLKLDIKDLVIEEESRIQDRTQSEIKNENDLWKRILGRQRDKQDYINDYRDNLEDSGKYSEEEINKKVAYLRSNYNPELEITDEEKLELGLDTRRKYSIKAVNNILNNRREIRQNKVNRIALTELGHAYNLGRLETYNNRDIELVKLNNSLEHLRRVFPEKYRSTYEKVANRINYSFQIKGVVCPVCQERAVRKNGYGKGIYLLSEVLTNRQLQLVFHPHCACYYEPIEETEKEKEKRKIKGKVGININKFFDNSLVKWASGGATTILGTGVMYYVFNKYLKNKIKPINNLSKNLINLIEENSGNINQTILENLNILNLPLKKVLPNDVLLELNETENNLAEEILNTSESDYYTGNVQENIELLSRNVTNEIVETNSINYEINLELENDIQNIVNRLNSYLLYNPNLLTTTEKQLLIRTYSNDLRKLNSLVNNLEKSNIVLYSKYKSLEKLKMEALEKLRISNLVIPNNVDEEIYLNSLNSIRRINNKIEEVTNKLIEINRNLDIDNIKALREDIESNPYLLKEFIKKSRTQIENNFNKIDNTISRLYNEELKTIENIINNTENISDNLRRQLLIELEVINYQIESRLKNFTYTLGDLNLEYLSLDLNILQNELLENNLLGKAIALNDYKNLIIESQKKVFVLTNKLLK